MVALASAIGLFAAAVPVASAHNNAHPSKPAFGTSVWGVDAMKSQGVKPAYAVIWVGEKEAEKGFPNAKKQMAMARDKGVTPLVQWYYWGDSISTNCVKYGCNGKSRGEWDSYAYKLRDAIKSVMGSRLTIVILETEFNKNGVQYMEDMDGYLAKQSWIFRGAGYQTVLGFGNWGESNWWRFNRAASASTYLGIQELSSAYRDSESTMLRSAEKIYSGGKRLHDQFGKRVMVTDFGVSSWKGKEWVQKREIQDVVWSKERFADAGIMGFSYRWVKDVPTASWGYHGYAEKYWGLQRSDGSWKPAMGQWVSGTKYTPDAWTAYRG